MFYINSIDKGGAERVITNLANYFSKDNDVLLVVTNKSKVNYVIDKKVNFISLKSNKFINKISKISLTKYLSLRKVIKNEKPDIVISFLPESGFRIAALKKYSKYMKNIPLIISIRNNPYVEYKGKIINRLMRFLYKNIDGLVVQTPDCLEYFKDILSCDKIVIANPLSDRFLNKKMPNKRRKEIVTVNSLTTKKNPFLVIKAFEDFVKENSDYHLIMYGDGPLRNDLQNYINENKLTDKITIAGNVDDVENKIIDSSIYVLPSNYEGMPNSLMEAMALGIPSIATDSPIGGCKMLINNNINGILIEVDNKDELVMAMKKITNDDKFANKLSNEARKIINEYDPKIINKKWEDYIYKHIKKGK